MQQDNNLTLCWRSRCVLLLCAGLTLIGWRAGKGSRDEAAEIGLKSLIEEAALCVTGCTQILLGTRLGSGCSHSEARCCTCSMLMCNHPSLILKRTVWWDWRIKDENRQIRSKLLSEFNYKSTQLQWQHLFQLYFLYWSTFYSHELYRNSATGSHIKRKNIFPAHVWVLCDYTASLVPFVGVLVVRDTLNERVVGRQALHEGDGVCAVCSHLWTERTGSGKKKKQSKIHKQNHFLNIGPLNCATLCFE